MKTLKNIHEGFFSNVGATGALYKSRIIEYLEDIKKNKDTTLTDLHIPQVIIAAAIEEAKGTPDDWFNNGLGDLLSRSYPDSMKIHHLRNFFASRLIITSDVFDSNITTLPVWFKLDSLVSFYKNIYDIEDALDVYIDSMPNLNPKEITDFLRNFKAVRGIHIANCPKFKDFEGFPKKIGKDGLLFKPSPNMKFKYRDVLKYFTDIEGPIIFNRVNDNYEDKLLKKAQAKKANDAKIKTKEKVDAISNGKDITKEPKERTKIKPWNGPLEDAPVWRVDDRNRVYMPDGTEFGRLTRDCTTVYRQVNKALFIKHPICYSMSPGDLIGYAYDKKDNLVCKLVRGNV